jgi:hypothetical protein
MLNHSFTAQLVLIVTVITRTNTTISFLQLLERIGLQETKAMLLGRSPSHVPTEHVPDRIKLFA